MSCAAPLGAASALSHDLELTTITYGELFTREPGSIARLASALRTDGAVAISAIPNFPEQRQAYFEAAIAFSELSAAEKAKVAAGGVGDTYSYLGYDIGAERYSGSSHADVSKASYYSVFDPNEADFPHNKWPEGMELKDRYLTLAKTIHRVGVHIAQSVDPGSAESLTKPGAHGFGRMLHYTPCEEGDKNPFWCGEHTDHSFITGLVAAEYRLGGKKADQPLGAGLEVKVDGVYRKVSINPDSLLFQVGEVGELMTGKMLATEHRVNKPNPEVPSLQRHTFALFIDPPMDEPIHSTSERAKTDVRYVDGMTFNDWHMKTIAMHEGEK